MKVLYFMKMFLKGRDKEKDIEIARDVLIHRKKAEWYWVDEDMEDEIVREVRRRFGISIPYKQLLSMLESCQRYCFQELVLPHERN